MEMIGEKKIVKKKILLPTVKKIRDPWTFQTEVINV